MSYVATEIVDTDEPVVPKELHDVDVEVAPPMDGLSKSDDPFTPREGKTLIWKDINMTLVSQKLLFEVLAILQAECFANHDCTFDCALPGLWKSRRT